MLAIHSLLGKVTKSEIKLYLELDIVKLEHDELRHLEHFEADWCWFVDLRHHFLEDDCGEVVVEHAEALAVRLLCQF